MHTVGIKAVAIAVCFAGTVTACGMVSLPLQLWIVSRGNQDEAARRCCTCVFRSAPAVALGQSGNRRTCPEAAASYAIW